jgi:hypothetical protein
MNARKPARKLDRGDQYQRAYEKQVEELRSFTLRKHVSADEIRRQWAEMEAEFNDYRN